jgi:hypothetical protein
VCFWSCCSCSPIRFLCTWGAAILAITK